jgi:hypothetical protein
MPVTLESNDVSDQVPDRYIFDTEEIFCGVIRIRSFESSNEDGDNRIIDNERASLLARNKLVLRATSILMRASRSGNYSVYKRTGQIASA